MQNHSMQDTQSKYCRYEKTCPLKTDRCKVWYMNSTAKVLIPNKEWLVKDGKRKIGSVSKAKKGYWFIKNGKHIAFKNLSEINAQFGTAIFEESIKKVTPEKIETADYTIYDYPCSNKPYEPVYNVKKKLPLFAKSPKSKCQYCAGYYTIKFRKGWVKGFCPKLITLDRYPFQGPFKTEAEMRSVLKEMNKNETT